MDIASQFATTKAPRQKVRELRNRKSRSPQQTTPQHHLKWRQEHENSHPNSKKKKENRRQKEFPRERRREREREAKGQKTKRTTEGLPTRSRRNPIRSTGKDKNQKLLQQQGPLQNHGGKLAVITRTQQQTWRSSGIKP